MNYTPASYFGDWVKAWNKLVKLTGTKHIKLGEYEHSYKIWLLNIKRKIFRIKSHSTFSVLFSFLDRNIILSNIRVKISYYYKPQT